MGYPEPEPKLPSRRAAINIGIRACEEIALLSAWSIHTLSQLKQSPSLPLSTFGYTPNMPNRLTNETHPNIEGGHIHNIGVVHIEPFFRQHKQLFENAITDCDALLLEGNSFSYPEYQRPPARSFFQQCIDSATTNNKTIYFIDQYRAPILFYQGLLSIPLAAFSSIVMNFDTQHVLTRHHRNAQQGTPSPPPLLSTRRNVLRALAGLGLASAWVIRMPDADNPEEYDGYIQRGRSAIMMRNTLTIAHAVPTAKLLTITGNVHAQLFEHYFADPSLLERDLNDYRFHDVIYSLPMEKIEPGDSTPKPL